jgi:hypothetical protein
MTPEQIGPREAAALMMAFFEHRGARFKLDDEGCLNVDLDPVDFSRISMTPHAAIAAILGQKEDIKAILREIAATQH